MRRELQLGRRRDGRRRERIRPDGSDRQLLAEVSYPAGLGLAKGAAWTIGLTGLYRIRVGEEPDFITGFSGPYEIAVDSSHLYFPYWNVFEDTHLGWIHRYPLLDGEYDPLAGEFVYGKFSPKPTTVRLDERAIYWATADEDTGEGGIWMVCRSAI